MIAATQPAAAVAERHDRADWRRWLGPALSLLLFAGVLYLLHRELEQHSWHDVLRHLRELTPGALLAAFGFTVASYTALSMVEALGLRHVGQAVPLRISSLTSFISYAVGHNIGLAALSGGAIRLRLYGSRGIGAADIAIVSAFCGLTTALGLVALTAYALLAEPREAAVVLHIGARLATAAGVACALLIAAYIVGAFLRRTPFGWRQWQIGWPRPPIAVGQVTASVVDLACSAAALYVLLPDTAAVSYAAFLAVFVLSVFAASVTGIPGGLGVIEYVIVLALPDVPTEQLLGRLLAFRIVYYLVPLVLSATLLAAHEFYRHRQHLERAANAAGTWLAGAAPPALGSLVFVGGGVLLLSGATPAIHSRIAGLEHWLPLALLEASHLLASIAGLGLLILSRSLFRRVREAWLLAMLVTLLGAVATLLKGFDYEEALILVGIAILLWLGRDAFDRKGRVLEQRLTPQWVLGLAIVVIGITWVGLLAHRHVEYRNDLWWTFAFDAHAPRMLRASLVVAVLAVGFVLLNLLAPGQPPAEQTLATSEPRVLQALEHATSSSAALALLGDKRFLFHESGDAFVMYQVSGRSWISMGDPVGPRDLAADLAWQFRERCDRYGAWSVFYEVSAASIHTYVDMGLALLKLGEEARVPLPDFGLAGAARADLRQAQRRAQRDGASFAVIEHADAALLQELRVISDAWLAEKTAAEKGFSVGRFDEQYLSRFPIAIVRNQERRIVAFSNLWSTPNREEVSVDLMRFGPGAPRGVMDFLFIEMMLWARDQGYHWFNLGMAPLAGLEQRPLAPTWHRLARLLYRYGENFYNFEGLRRYKEKFDPVWEPHYLAAPGGLALPRVLVDVTTLIAGGMREVIRK
jgi:phosphatidylglycerol lysyltransferase